MKILSKLLIALILIANHAFAGGPAHPYDDCGNVGDLSAIGSPYSGTTTGATNDYSFCSMTSATDQIFYYDLPVGSTITINQSSNAYDSRHSLRYGGACPGTTEIVCTDDPDTQVETWQNCTGSLQRVYWIQSGYSTNDGSYTLQWSVTAGSCPIPPTNDDCSGAIALTVNPDQLCGTVTAGTINLATASTDANTCGGTDDDDVWFSFVATGTTHYIDLLNVSGSTTDLYHAVFTGTCGSLGSPILCSDPNSSTLTGLTIGQTYYVRVYSWTSSSGQTTSFDICIGSDPPPTVINGCSGTFYDSGGAGGAYGNSELYTTVYCSGVAGQCVTLTFTSFSTESCCDDLTIYDGPDASYPLIGTYAGTTLNGQSVQASTGCLTFVWDSDGSVTNPGWSANVSCSACPTCTDGILNGQEIGIDCGGPTCPACPCSSLPISNDEACCATPLTVNPDLLCGTTTAGTVANATPSFNANSCFGTDDDDVWFSFVATQTNHEIDLLNIAGSVTDMYHAVYGGTCSATGTALICSDANSSSLTGLTVGNTYFIRVYTYTSIGGQNTTFDVCVGTPPPNGPCGNPANNDYCSDPAVLTQGGAGWSSSTTSIYSADTPANSGTLFCGSVENNSWYVFTAQATSETFFFSSVTNCIDGIQAEVYEVTHDVNGCCTGFTSMSNCWNPWAATSGTVTATGLTIGNDYILMIDGYAGANCDFTVDNWTAAGILPVTLVKFSGYSYESGNKLVWTTQSEINNDYFIVQKSYDTKNFVELGIVDGNGTTNNVNDYSFIDEFAPSEVTYYRLKQIDFDGKYEYSEIIAVVREKAVEVTIYPNPSKNNLFFDLSQSEETTYTIRYTNILGSVHEEKIAIAEGKNTYQVMDFVNLTSGIYFVQILDQNNEVIKTQKIVKE